ncbi:MAG: hypothetical protein RBR68_11840 [Tenuifilaceae bacterium]|nr:hypothetical protein [Tenuifilaceae bacterium]
MTVKRILRNKLININTIKDANSGYKCPVLFETTVYSRDTLSSIFSLANIPKINSKSISNTEYIEYETEKIKALSLALSESANKLLSDYSHIINMCNTLYKRIENESLLIERDIGEIVEYYCLPIDISFSNQTKESYVGKIGKFLTLPYFMENVKMYDDAATISISASDKITFQNISEIDHIPLNKAISCKILSKKDLITFLTSININATDSNLVYIKFSNKVNSINVKLFLDNIEVYSYDDTSNEILLNFNHIKFNSISITTTISNPNTDKPLSIHLENIQIFENIQFSKFGVFESIPSSMDTYGDFSKIGLTYKNKGPIDTTNTVSLMSISGNLDANTYNIIDKNTVADISIYKYQKKCDIFNDDIDGAVKDTLVENIDGTDYNVRSLYESHPLWYMNYKKALILFGLSRCYINPDYWVDQDNEQYETYKNIRYDSWTLNNNYYKTTLLNWEDNIFLNIGGKTCLINGKPCSGNIKVPIGFSVIEVHRKDMNFDVNIFDKASVLSDPLYPYNFAYMLSGLPEYNTSGNGILNKISKNIQLREDNEISLGESFIPFSEYIIDNMGNEYSIQLTRTVSQKGTYTIEPNSGKIKICPMDGANIISIEYRKAIYNRRPVGITFNRLLTYAPLSSTLFKKDNSLFSFDGSPITKKVILPFLVSGRPVFSQVIYNIDDFSLYSSVRLELETEDKYLTPIVSDVYLMVE